MAQRLNIDIVARDKSKQALNSLKGRLGKVKASVFNLRNAFIGLGVGLAVKGIITTGKEIESLQVRLKFLFGSVEEGSKAFNKMSEYAGRVPFSLGQIQQGAGVLAVVSKDADQMAKMMKITGNVAAVTGLDFKTTAEQIQRSMSAGISAADLFRDRGVKSMLGFKAGATVSIEETAKALERVFGEGGKFDGATDELAKTLEGTLSMIGDKYFNFQKDIAARFFRGLKKEFGDLDKALEENERVMQNIAKAIGESLSDAVILAGKGIKIIADNFESIKRLAIAGVVYGLAKAFIYLAITIRRAGLAMLRFNRTSMKNLIGLLAVAGLVIAETTGYLEKFFQMFKVPPTIEELGLELKMITAELEMLKDNGEKAFEGIKFEAYKLRDALKLSQLGLEETSEEFKELERMINAVEEAISNVPLQNLTFGLDEQTEKVGILTQAWRNFSEGFNEAITKQKTGMEQIKEIGKNTFKELKNVLTDFVMTGKLKFEDFARSIIRQFVEMLIGQAIQFALKKSMAMFKMDALKKAMISLYEGAMKTFASIPFPWNMLVVGGAIAAGKSIINKMKSHEQGGAVSKGRPVLVGERGPELFVPNTTGQITQNARGTDTGTTNINFSINATDVTGVRKLLIDNRATIVNVINSALNEKGREALV